MKRLLVFLRVRSLASLALFFLAILIAISIAPSAIAAPRGEAAAKDALKRAEDEYLQMDFEKALRRLQAAQRACGATDCTNATRAALIRDIGVMQLRLGDREAALASFGRAKKTDPSVALNPSYEAKDLREAWDAEAAPPRPAGGDFSHKPPAEQAVRTPLPIYVIATTTEALANVALKYKNDDMKAFRRVALKKMGDGWGGYVPCADMVPGTMRYFIQGFTKDGELVASAGDPQNTFSVIVKDAISGDPPALPGEKPPRTCGDEDLETLNLLGGDRCQEDRQCKSGACVEGRCKAPSASAEEEAPAGGKRDFARLWIGIGGALDLTFTPAKNDVCKLSGGASTSPFWCTTPDGNDYPSNDVENNALVGGRAGQTQSGVNPGGFHVMATLDYAVNTNLLLGGRFGFVAGAYPGKNASSNGRTFGTPLHAELRATYLFGDEPIARTGLAPYVFASGGVARFDASTTVLVGEKNVVGDRAVQAWLVAGPVFAGAGGGARYAFSRRAAVSTGLVIDAAIGPGAFAFILAPEIQLQYGF